MNFIRTHILFIVLLMLCAVLRLLPLFDYEFTYDELSGLERTTFGNFGDLVRNGIMPDAHPALIQSFIYLVTRCCGYTEWVLKLPFLLLSFGVVVYAYRFGLRHFSRQTGLFASAIFAFSLVFVYYAPVARMYIAGVFFSLGLLYHFYGIFFIEVSRQRDYTWFAVFALLSALNHHVNALFAFSVAISGIFLMRKEQRVRYLIACACAVALYLPHISITLHQLSLAGIGPEQGGWLDPPPPDALFRFIRILFGTGHLWLVVLLAALLFTLRQRPWQVGRKRWLLLVLFLVNYAVVHLYSVLRAPIFQNSVMLFSGTALVLFVTSFSFTSNKWLFASGFAALAGLLLAQTYGVKDYFGQCVHTVFDHQFRRTAELKREFGDDRVYPLLFDADRNMKRIYFMKYPPGFECKTTEDSIMGYANRKFSDGTTSFSRFSRFVSGLKAEYVAMSSPMPLHESVVREYFPYLTESTETHAVNFRVFSRKPVAGKTTSESPPLYVSTREKPSGFEYQSAPQSDVAGKTFGPDPSVEFPLSAKAPYKKVIAREGQMLLVRALLKMDTPAPGLEICISVNDGDNKTIQYAAKAASDFILKQDSTLWLYSDMFMGTSHRSIDKGAVITCFIWNRDKTRFRLLDFDIQVIDHWQNKWNYWD